MIGNMPNGPERAPTKTTRQLGLADSGGETHGITNVDGDHALCMSMRDTIIVVVVNRLYGLRRDDR